MGITMRNGKTRDLGYNRPLGHPGLCTRSRFVHWTKILYIAFNVLNREKEAVKMLTQEA